jgi:dTMP kinase
MERLHAEKKGKLIVIEGIDSSGKATQSRLLYEKLAGLKKNVKKIEFPDYGSPSSSLVKMYLSGDFGSDPRTVNAYGASIFYAADRFASFKAKWENFYRHGGIVIADRYVSSNMIYQAAKFDDSVQRKQYLDWIDDLEYKKLGLPRPSIVLFLNLSPSFCADLSIRRNNKFTGKSQKDIHEADKAYMEQTYAVAMDAARQYGWHIIACSQGDAVRSVEDISAQCYEKVKDVI